MDKDSSYHINIWREIFMEFQQIENVRADFDTNRLDIRIKGRKEIIRATQAELDDALYKFNSNPREVATQFLKRNGILVYYQDTLVGFFDIQGYSSFINSTSIENAVHGVSRFFNQASSSAGTDFHDIKLDHWILSDSIILAVDTNRRSLFAGSLEVFLGTCSMIMRNAITNSFPLRGAIGGGDFYKDGEIMVSSALVDAALYEKEQDWLGAILTPKAIGLVEKAKEYEMRTKGISLIDLSSNRFSNSVRYGAIPWKLKESSLIRPSETYYIKPFEMSEHEWAKKYLPTYFNDSQKIINSHILYGVE